MQLPWESIFFGIVSIITFGLANVTAQYTSMLSVPPLPFLGIAGRPGEAKSVLIWFIKAVMIEVQRRDNDEDVLDPEEAESMVQEGLAPAVVEEAHQPVPADAAPAPEIKMEADKQADAARKKSCNRYLVDMGTLYGYLLRASQNKGRAFAALHEAKTLLAKVVAEAPGFDPQALNKIYDRDEISNTVMGTSSRFHMDHPWVIFFLVLHLEELKTVFGDGKDSCNILARFDFFHRQSLVPDLEDFNDYSADEAIGFVTDVLQLIQASYPKLDRQQLRGLPQDMAKFYSKRTGLWMLPQDNEFFKQSFKQHSAARPLKS